MKDVKILGSEVESGKSHLFVQEEVIFESNFIKSKQSEPSLSPQQVFPVFQICQNQLLATLSTL